MNPDCKIYLQIYFQILLPAFSQLLIFEELFNCPFSFWERKDRHSSAKQENFGGKNVRYVDKSGFYGLLGPFLPGICPNPGSNLPWSSGDNGFVVRER